MKQTLSVILILLLLLTGCHSGESNGTPFYYCRDAQQDSYFEERSVIHAEHRELHGHWDDLQYMVGLYLAGPVEEGLTAPFPKSVRLLSVKKDHNEIIVELSDQSHSLTDSEFSLACACLTLTCINFTNCVSVTVISGSRSLTMTADQIILLDTLPQQETTGG